MKNKVLLLMGILLFFVSTNVYANTSNDKTKSWIDYPRTNESIGNSLKIQGWVLSKETNTEVEVYLDNTKQETQRVKRDDVFKAIKNYGSIVENPTPGYYKVMDISNLSYGNHMITINVLKGGKKILTDKVVFNHVSPKTLINIDYPALNKEYNRSDKLKIQGWVMSEESNPSVEFYIDGVKRSEELDRLVREDVIRIIKGYGTIKENPTPGIYKLIDVSNLNYGKHTLKIVAKDKEGRVLKEESRVFNLKTPKTLINIDYPALNKEYSLSNKLKIQGWVMSEESNPTVEFYIDGVKRNEVLDRLVREDVIRIIKGYGTIKENPTPGIYKLIDVSNLNYGKHTLKIVAKDKERRVLKEESRVFNLRAPKSIIHIDYPASTSNGENIKIQGWYLSEAKDTRLEIKLDNNLISDYDKSTREDVYKVYKNTYTRNTIYPGYFKNYNTSNLKDGKHTINLKILSNIDNKVILEKNYDFSLKKVKAMLNIDYFEQSKINPAYYIQGWEMSTSNNSYVKVFIDNNLVQDNITRIPREDVINAISGYGSIKENSTPGIKGYVDISNIAVGSHKVKIIVYSKYDEEIASISKNIHIYSKNYIDNRIQYNIPYYNQHDGRWDKKKYGLSTFGSNGCTPTALAMAFSAILGREVLPTEVADYLFKNTNEFNKRVKGSSGMAVVYATNKFHIKRIPIKDISTLNKELSKGKIVYAAMGNGKYATAFWNHGIIMHGYNASNGNTYTIDPLNTNNNVWINTSAVWSQRSRDPDDSRGGAFFYSLDAYN